MKALFKRLSIAFFLLFQQTLLAQIATVMPVEKLKGPVKEVWTYRYGMEEGAIPHNINPEKRDDYSLEVYNNDGELIELSTYNHQGAVLNRAYRSHNGDTIILENYTGAKMLQLSKWKREGLKEIKYLDSHSGKLLFYCHYVYKNDKPIQKIFYNTEGEVLETNTLKWDGDYLMYIANRSYSTDGEIKKRIIRNENDDIEKVIEEGLSGDYKEFYRIYAYDAYGNWVKYFEKKAMKEPHMLTIRNIIYENDERSTKLGADLIGTWLATKNPKWFELTENKIEIHEKGIPTIKAHWRISEGMLEIYNETSYSFKISRKGDMVTLHDIITARKFEFIKL